MVDGASSRGMFGMVKRQCLRIPFHTRNWSMSAYQPSTLVVQLHTCHVPGTFFRFTRTISIAAIRE